jgi:hypothetical protein
MHWLQSALLRSVQVIQPAMQADLQSTRAAAGVRAPRSSNGHKENGKLSASHLRPLQAPPPQAPLLVDVDKESLEFASPRAPTSTMNGERKLRTQYSRHGTSRWTRTQGREVPAS